MAEVTQAPKIAFIAKPIKGESKEEFKARLKKIINTKQ